jgi:DNA polymerase-3 subunit delta
MAALKRQAFLDALRRPDPAVRFWLVAGPDPGGATDLARRAVAALSGGDESIVRDLSAAELETAAGRLVDEAAALSLFGDRQVLRLWDGSDSLADAVNLLLEAPAVAHPVVMLAVDAGKSSPLKAAAAAHPAAIMVECWPLGESEGLALVRKGARARGLGLPRDSEARIWAQSGADPAVLEQELDKLAQAAGASAEAPRALDDGLLDALLPGGAETDFNAMVEALLRRDRAALATALAGLESESMIGLLRAAARQLLLLAELCDACAAGLSPAEAVARHRPPLFWKLRDPMVAALGRWRTGDVARALDLLLEAERAIKAPRSAGDRLAMQALLRLALARQALGPSAMQP